MNETQNSELFAKIKEQLMDSFMRIHDIAKFNDWQLNLLNQPIENRVGLIMWLPPGSGKTMLSIWTIMEHLVLFPTRRILFAVPLRALAIQQTRDIENNLNELNKLLGMSKQFTVATAEGPGGVIDWKNNNIYVATYEHAAGELRKNPQKQAIKYTIGLVFIDEVHELAKDRGFVVDDILYFSNLRRLSKPKDPTTHVIAMSGTLEKWIVNRMIDSYPTLFNNRFYGAVLKIDSNDIGAKAKRVYLPDKVNGKDIEQFKVLFHIIKNVLFDPSMPRMVVFMDTVKNAEAAFIGIASIEGIESLGIEYRAPKIMLYNSKKDINNILKKSQIEISQSTNIDNLVRYLEERGIYIHHAQLSEVEPGQLDIVTRQIGQEPPKGGFRIVISTSTISTGINLAPTTVGFLSKNTMWTVDQAEQMMGRVGRKRGTEDKSIIYIVNSRKYIAPGSISIQVPLEWFSGRALAALDFNRSFFNRNFDIRGFYSPPTAAPLMIPDEPGNGVLQMLEQWGIAERIQVRSSYVNDDNETDERTEQIFLRENARALIALSNQDIRSLLATRVMLENPTNEFIIIAWAMLINRVRLPPDLQKTDTNSELKQKTIEQALIPIKKLFVHNELKVIEDMIVEYGKTHSKYLGDPSVPNEKNKRLTAIYILQAILYAGYSYSRWPYGHGELVPKELQTYIVDAYRFLDSISNTTGAGIIAESFITQHNNGVAFLKTARGAKGFLYAFMRPGLRTAIEISRVFPDSDPLYDKQRAILKPFLDNIY